MTSDRLVQLNISLTPEAKRDLADLAYDRGLTVSGLVAHIATGRLRLVPAEAMDLYGKILMADSGVMELARIGSALEKLSRTAGYSE